MRRWLIAGGVVALLVAAGVAAYVVHRERQLGDVRGSATVEYSTGTGTTVGVVPGVQWPMYGFGAARTRAVRSPLRPPFRKVWTYHAGSLVEFPPGIGYGRLYLATNSGKVAAVNVKTGKRAWKWLSHRCVAASPAVGAFGSLFMSFLNKPPCNRKQGAKGIDGEVIRFAVGLGHRIWTRRIGPSESSPLLVKGKVYVGDWNGDVWDLEGHDGHVVWKRHVGGAVKGGIAYAKGRLYFGSYDGHVYCLSASTGRLIWRASAQGTLLHGGRFYATPAVAHGRVYVGATDGRLYSFGARTGKLRWSHGTGGYVYSSAAVWRNLVFVGSYSHRFFAFDAATGERRWSFKANGPISGSPTVVGDVVYFATLKQRTYALAARTGRKLWTFPDGKYSPVVAAGGRLFLVGYGLVYGMAPRR
ncbi:MAG TPA: PQQ-binding-like beta-propeller repeat protein [Gaiellaceae bacterium]|nr:PQQ-binding-like beta-propeller repeat protein [Gaiellaceae bacterium]